MDQTPIADLLLHSGSGHPNALSIAVVAVAAFALGATAVACSGSVSPPTGTPTDEGNGE